MAPDPLSNWLSSGRSVFARAAIYALAVLIGSALPRLVSGEAVIDEILVEFVGQAFLACFRWGSLCWLGWLTIPGIIYHGYVFVTVDTPKKSLFIGFSLTFFLFFSYAFRQPVRIAFLLLIYGIIFSLFFVLPKFLSHRGNTSLNEESKDV
jgi:hypothetical protein